MYLHLNDRIDSYLEIEIKHHCIFGRKETGKFQKMFHICITVHKKCYCKLFCKIVHNIIVF